MLRTTASDDPSDVGHMADPGSAMVVAAGDAASVRHLGAGAILNRVAQYPQVLDRTFSALADAHRRKILDRLSDGPVSISELAVPLGMSLPGVLKHVRGAARRDRQTGPYALVPSRQPTAR
jgi:hypothetical protein